MAEERKTKAMYFAEIREIIEATVNDQEQQSELLEFVDGEMATIEKRREAAKARAEKRKAESDALTDRIYDILTDDFVTLDEIMLDFENEEGVTKNKVTARLGKLVKAGKVEKESVRSEGKNRMTYRRAA